MITESDRLNEQQSRPQNGKSKRERRRDRARRLGEWQCDNCRHANMDHTPMRHSRDRFCHACLDVCTHK